MRAIAVLALLLGCSSGKSPGSDSAGPQDSADDTGDTATRVPIQGLLQFKVEHNLETDDCLARGDCHGQLEETDEGATKITWLVVPEEDDAEGLAPSGSITLEPSDDGNRTEVKVKIWVATEDPRRKAFATMLTPAAHSRTPGGICQPPRKRVVPMAAMR